MNLSDFGIDAGLRKTLVVLGAGASRGASFVTDRTAPLPPLDADFFQQLGRLRESTPGLELLRFVRSEYGHEGRVSMEQFFSEADYTNRFHRELNVDQGPIVRRYERALKTFHLALSDLLEATTGTDCEYHNLLAARLHSQDAVVSFNYDCIMDRALRSKAGSRWDPTVGYGFEIQVGAFPWAKRSKGRNPKSTIQLLKMHGSVNWRRSGDTIELTPPQDPVSTEGVVIPPTWFKNLTLTPYGDVWKAARKAVRGARALLVIGYSVPETDLFSRSLIKVEAGSKEKREKLDLLVLVNPERRARHKFLDLVSGGLEQNTRVLEFETLENLATLVTRHSKE